METNQESRKLAAAIVNKIGNKLPPALAEAFRCRVKAGYQSLPLENLVQGSWTVQQQFSIIERSLKDLIADVDAIKQRETIPWMEISFLLLRMVEKSTLSRQTPVDRVIPVAKPQKKESRRASLSTTPLMITSPSPDVPVNHTDKASSPPPRTPTDAVVVDRIYRVVAQRLNDSVCLYDTRCHKYVKCERVDCEFCRSMYTNLELTQCSMFGHPNCNSVGYFPHIGITMWKMLRKQHDAGSPFVPKLLGKVKPTDLPRLSARAPPVSTGVPENRKRIRTASGNDPFQLPIENHGSKPWIDSVEELELTN